MRLAPIVTMAVLVGLAAGGAASAQDRDQQRRSGLVPSASVKACVQAQRVNNCVIEQDADNNVSGIVQAGDENNAATIQRGKRNTATTTQIGRGG